MLPPAVTPSPHALPVPAFRVRTVDPAPAVRGAAGPAPGAWALAAVLAERNRDLQRLKAEYDNYRSRVHRDRLAVREVAVANVLLRLLPVLDAVDEAGRQGELTGGFLRVAKALEAELAGLGLTRFGAPGEAFDPRVHRAVAYLASDRVSHPVCAEVVRPGHRVGDQMLRPAEVTVLGPPSGG
ncbi:nucleotide exchange factor GrpE [Streptomyces sp. MUM 203J]|nr:nucleotide exchange factor GrpE [Streptomyces sp. MUM 203J]